MVAIIRRNPNRALTVVQDVRPLSVIDEVEMLAKDIWRDWEPVSFGTTSETLPMDMYEQKDELVMRMELPGIKREDIDISLENNLLTIQAERKQETADGKATYYLSERCFGCYSRSVSLPFPVDTSKVHTTFEDGLLEIRLPKAEEAKAKHIEIKVGSTPKAITSKSK